MIYKGYIIHKPDTGGKAGKGFNKTSTLQVRKPVLSGYLQKAKFRFLVGDAESETKAIENAKKWIDTETGKPVQTSLFSYSTDGAYRGTLQIVAENLACANTALVHFLDEEMGVADPPMSADDWALTFVCPVGGDIQSMGTDRTIPQGESVVLDYDWILNEG